MSRLFLFDRSWTWWMLGILLLACVAYGAALNNQLIPFDDNTLIYDNPTIAYVSFNNLLFAWTHYDPELYIPLTFVMYQIIHAFAGFNPTAYHAASLLLHLLNIILVGWIVFQLTKKQAVALVTALLFALHPLQSETVLWAAAMKDVLSSFFGLLSLGLYLRSRETDERRFLYWSLLCFVLGLLSKVSIVLFPLLFLMTDYLQGRPLTKKSLLNTWPFFTAAFIFFIVAIIGKTEVIKGTGGMVTLLLSFKATMLYMVAFFWPLHLSLLYPQLVLPKWEDPVVLLGVVFVAALLGLAFVCRQRVRVITFGIGWYLLLLLPSFSNFYKNEHLYVTSDRYAYLPTIGVMMILAVGSVTLWDRFKKSRIPLIVLLCMAIICGVALTHRQVTYWKDSHTLFARVIELQPDTVVAYNNYAITLGYAPESVAYYKKAIALDADFMLGYRNLAHYYLVHGDNDLRHQTLEDGAAILLKKKYPQDTDLSLLYELAEYFDEQGNREKVLYWLQKALDLKPLYWEGWYNMGVKREKYGQLEEARIALEKALEQGGDRTDVLYHLAAVDAQTGKLAEAAELLEKLIRINPTYEKAQTHLANIRKLLRE